MIVRLYTGPDGKSHFEEVDLSFTWEHGLERTPLQGATGITFGRMPPGHFID